jgi:predicted nucleic acid-binding protein
VIVLDANILVRAVLGRRVRELLAAYGTATDFFTPDFAFAEARQHLPRILANRGFPSEPGLALLESLSGVVQIVDVESYGVFEEIARERLLHRDLDDWPVLATALALNCPIWTEDRDFFGSGVATWTTDRIEYFLRTASTGQREDLE